MPDDIRRLKEKLVLAHKIMAAAGVLQMNLGHASVRLPEGNRVLILGHLHDVGKVFEGVTVDDLSVMDLEGNHLEGGLEPPGERYIHSGIYKARPEVGAVVHAHPFMAVACTIAGRDLIPVGHWGTVFHPKVPVYPSSEQIETQRMGEDIARVMGSAPAVLLKHHGAVSAGKFLEQAVAVMLSLEHTARLLAAACQMGTPEALPPEQIRSGKAVKLDRPSFWENPWAYWSSRVS
ncbi:MAG: class II aldolase/adducin family protein [Candidatus Tectomicrobia bacterium]|nr:class II aldolase/adducin family protein [Candidatus Tectomicrobia bacterium]